MPDLRGSVKGFGKKNEGFGKSCAACVLLVPLWGRGGTKALGRGKGHDLVWSKGEKRRGMPGESVGEVSMKKDP